MEKSKTHQKQESLQTDQNGSKLIKKGPKAKSSEKSTRKVINKERFDRISKWRQSQKLKQDKEDAKLKEQRDREREKLERERLRKLQKKKKKEEQLRVSLEAKRLKVAHEKKRLEIERELFEKERTAGEKPMPNMREPEGQKEIKEAGETDVGDIVDPLDAFMSNLTETNKSRDRKRANTKLSDNLQKALEKTVKMSKNPLRIEKNEVLENETRYDLEDLVIKEEPSWLDKMRQKKKEIRQVDHEKMEYNAFRKNFYIEAPEITAMSDKEVDEYRNDKLEGVKIRGKNCPRPIFKWSQCGLPSKVYDVLKHFEYSEPFPIQSQSIPCIMSGRDVIACAKTGSGKTLAFVLPMFRHILDQDPIAEDEGPIGLIVTPTRELAKQTTFEIKKFAAPLNLRVVCCNGGATVADNIADLKRGAEIIVATPGRMIDMLCVNGGRVTNTRRVTYLVLDEADRMFDMGFEPQIMTIINNTRPARQTVLFSATFPRQIESLVKEIMHKPVEIVIGGRNVASNSVIQSVKVVNEYEKFNMLLKILGENYHKGQILIFTDRQEAVDELFIQLQRAGYFTLTLHGGMDQTDRDSMIVDFRNKTRSILIATSIAARGLDVKDLNLVINYTVPNHYEDYIHRIGRTGRAGMTGYSITFITPEEEKFAPDLLKALTLSKQTNIPQKLIEMVEGFKDKVEKGEQKFSHGVRTSGSKGFKFDESEQYKQKLDKQRQEAVYGTSANKDMSENDMLLKQNEAILENASANKAKDRSKPLTLLDRQLAAAKAGAAAIKTTINMASATHTYEEAQALAQVAYQSVYIDTSRSEVTDTLKGKAEAVAKSLSISQKLTSLGANATPQKLAEALNQRQYCKKFVINDYPQQARLKVTNRQSISNVMEFSDVRITTRGSYFAPGRNPGPGEEKLTMLVEGKSPMEVERAYFDLKQIVEEIAKSGGSTQQSYGKYQVV